MNKKIIVLPGDGIGPEIIDEALKVLSIIEKRGNHVFETVTMAAGGCAYDLCGNPLPDETFDACKNSDAILLGAVGGFKWDKLDLPYRPERVPIRLRSELNLYVNYRPTKLFKQLESICPLKTEVFERGIDFVILRELAGGIYYGRHTRHEENGEPAATDVLTYRAYEVRRIAEKAFQLARTRRRKVTSIDKINVLVSSHLWREVVHTVAEDYPDVELVDMLVDNAAMQIVRNPAQFDVIVTENLFGDILSDEASAITGSIGMAPSSSVGDGTLGVYEPIHGSAPDIAGKNLANPLGTILSAALLLRHSLNLGAAADMIEQAVNATLDQGFRTADILSTGMTRVSCSEMGDLVVKNL